MNLICNLPAEKVWVRREYLRDHQDGCRRRLYDLSITPEDPKFPDFKYIP